jgi:hypothetical protein
MLQSSMQHTKGFPENWINGQFPGRPFVNFKKLDQQYDGLLSVMNATELPYHKRFDFIFSIP